MGRVIQAESRNLEYPYVLMFEHDPNVLEYWDQPDKVRLPIPDVNGRKAARWYTPDFLVIRRDEVWVIEVKPEQTLEKLHRKNPLHIAKHEDGTYWNPAAEEYFAERGIRFKIVTDSGIDPIVIANLRILEPYLSTPIEVAEAVKKAVISRLDSAEGCTLEKLLAFGDIELDQLYQLIADGVLHMAFNHRPVLEHHVCRLFRKPKDVARFLESLAVLPNEIRDEAELSPAMVLWLAATRKDQDLAIQRWKWVERHIAGEGDFPCSQATIYRYVKAYKDAERLFGWGLVGLLSRHDQKGNRAPRVSAHVLAILRESKKTLYDTPEKRTKRSFYVQVRNILKDKGLDCPSKRTVYKFLDQHQDERAILKRDGHKIAAAVAAPHQTLEFDEHKRGLFPYDVVHIDHTVVDVFCLGEWTALEPTKPVLTTITDAYSRMILAYFLSFDAASLVNALMALRAFFRRHRCAMRHLVHDGGAEFKSGIWEILLAIYKINKIERRKSTARDGSTEERLFGTFNQGLFHYLHGNTQQLQQCRAMSRDLDPRGRAIWTLSALHQQVEKFINNYYHVDKHDGLGCSPQVMWNLGMSRMGQHMVRPVTDMQEMLFRTLPRTRNATVKLAPMGLFVNHRYYTCDLLKRPKLRGKYFEVVWEPEDVGVVEAHIDGAWRRCYSQDYGRLQGLTAEQIAFYSHESRHLLKKRGGDVAGDELYGALLREVNRTEAVLATQQPPMPVKKPKAVKQKAPERGSLVDHFGFGSYVPKVLEVGDE